MVDLSSNHDYAINKVTVYNRNDCCMEKISDSQVQILDENKVVVAHQTIPAGASASSFQFYFDNVMGRYVRVRKNGYGDLQIAEVQVFGWSMTKSPSRSPSLAPTTATPTLRPTYTKMPITKSPTFTPTISASPTKTLINLALISGAVASQSSTYEGNNGANIAIDGVKSDGATNVGSTHTQCSDTPFPWWRVYFGLGQIKTVKVYNRNDCVSFSCVILIVHSFVS